MASAAAVAADEAISPPGDNLGEDLGLPGEVTSAVKSTEELEREDEEDGDGDLFGDEDEDDLPKDPLQRRKRLLDDEELDSGDDLDRSDRAADEQEEEQQYEERSYTVADFTLPRQPFPKPSDNEMYLLKVPTFLEIDEKAFQHTEFQPPTTDHHSKTEPSATFSAYNTAMTTIRWRRSPSNQTEMQSNARILRWSDGSLTLQLASDPTMQYEMDGNALAPPQRNPLKPTPTSISINGAKGKPKTQERYQASKDAFTYLVAPYTDAQSLVVTNKLTAGLTIKQSDMSSDEAVQRLQAALTNATNANTTKGAGDMNLKLVEEDPENARRRAEDAMRQKQKADKRREAAIQREADRSNRALGRHGLSSGRYGTGLNASMLEDEDGMGAMSRPKSGPRKARRRRGSEYSSDEDLGRSRFSKQDEYDEEDDFVAPSDEEEVIEDDDDDPDEGLGETVRDRSRTPKRDRAADDEEDAEGEPDDEVQQARVKRRRVIDDEDEDE